MIKLFRLILFILFVSFICFYPLTNVIADGGNDNTENDLGLSILPKENLFDISNMKPGDWAPRTITVQNTGNKDFVYYMQLQNSGEEKLFNELTVEIKAGNTELFKGKLTDFKSLSERKLTNGNEEKLDITISFPEHLGNEFQGLESSFVFSFTAEGKDSTTVQVMTTGQVASVSTSPDGFNQSTGTSNIVSWIFFTTILAASGIVFMIIRFYRRMKMSQV